MIPMSAEEIKQVLENCKLHFCYLLTAEELIETAVSRINDHRIIAWMHGRMESLQGLDWTRHVTMLFDEIESHLHPRWQRAVLHPLLGLAAVMRKQAELQLIAARPNPERSE